jgi:hypothetical protein
LKHEDRLIDEYITKLNNEKVFGVCEECGQDILEGELYFYTIEGSVHALCFEEFAKRLLYARDYIAGEER